MKVEEGEEEAGGEMTLADVSPASFSRRFTSRIFKKKRAELRAAPIWVVI
jgi:hypothetical protein